MRKNKTMDINEFLGYNEPDDATEAEELLELISEVVSGRAKSASGGAFEFKKSGEGFTLIGYESPKRLYLPNISAVRKLQASIRKTKYNDDLDERCREQVERLNT